MKEKYVDVSSGRLLQGLRGHGRLVAVCVLLGLAVAGARLLLGGPSYSAQSQVLIGQPLTIQSLTTGTAANVDQTRLVDYTQRVLQSSALAGKVEDRLDLDEDDYTLDVVSANATNVIGLRVGADDPQRAQAVANAFARTYIASVKAENTAKVERAVEQLRTDLGEVDARLAQLRRQLVDAGSTAAAAAVLAPERTALVQRRVMLHGMLSQARLVGAVDPGGGARVVERAEAGETSLFAIVAPLALGGLFGLLVGVGAVALRRAWAGRMTGLHVDSGATADEPATGQGAEPDGSGSDPVLPGAPEPATA